MKLSCAILVIVHGLIVAGQATTSFNPTGGVPNPAWLSGWPANLGQSWLGFEQTLLARTGGLLWLAAGLALVAAGLGVMAIGVPAAWSRRLMLTGAALSLGMLVLYLHPFYALGLGASAALVAALV